MEAERGYHVPTGNLEFLAGFYADIYDFENSHKLYSEILSQATTDEARAECLAEMTYLSYQLQDISKLRQARQQFKELSIEDSHIHDISYQQVLYYSCALEEKKGNKELAQQFRKEMADNFPNSPWLKMLDEKDY